MTLREFYSSSATPSRADPRPAPLFDNSVLARTSSPRMTPVSRWLAWILAALVAAAIILAAGYWGYRQVQPRPLFTPAAASERADIPAPVMSAG